ncbi:MAG: class B sortase [Clostridium sp.]|nr:class B sortase [Clostridium sp.]
MEKDKQMNDKTGKQANNKKSRQPNKKRKKNRAVYWVLLVLLFAVFAGCLIYLVKYFWESKKSEDKVDELRELVILDEDSGMNKPSFSTSSDADNDKDVFEEVDGKKILRKYVNLYKRNNDFIGWLTIEGTVIDYPVMQSMYDEEFYLRRDFDKEYSYAGTLFIDTSCNVEKPSDNIIIYGHHMNTGKMFHELEEYDDEEYYEKHKFITFDTIYGSGNYEVIAAFRTKIYDEDYTGFKYYEFFDARDSVAFENYVSNCKSLTPYNIEASAKYGDSLITLSTCAYHTENGRFVVVAKKLN